MWPSRQWEETGNQTNDHGGHCNLYGLPNGTFEEVSHLVTTRNGTLGVSHPCLMRFQICLDIFKVVQERKERSEMYFRRYFWYLKAFLRGFW